jgi:hypothetical protein
MAVKPFSIAAFCAGAKRIVAHLFTYAAAAAATTDRG